MLACPARVNEVELVASDALKATAGGCLLAGKDAKVAMTELRVDLDGACRGVLLLDGMDLEDGLNGLPFGGEPFPTKEAEEVAGGHDGGCRLAGPSVGLGVGG